MPCFQCSAPRAVRADTAVAYVGGRSACISPSLAVRLEGARNAVAPESSNDAARPATPRRQAPASPAVFDTPTGVAHCIFCPGRHLRISRLRFQDLIHIAQFEFPVRCGRCGQRQFVSPLVAALSGRHRILRSEHRRQRPETQTWASWTEFVPNETKDRPMTTVAGPRAARLEKRAPKPARPANTRRDEGIW